MKKMACRVAGICLVAVAGYGATVAENLATVLALGNLTNAPTMYVDDTSSTIATVSQGEQKAVYFEGLDYTGSATRVYAYVGIPAGASAGSPVPGVVLVHGGGGTAFPQWVDLWTNRGYAAISIAVEGQTDTVASQAQKDAGLAVGNWLKHAMPGPARGVLYADSPDTITNQWMYHAVADTVLANSLMRSLTGVVSTNVGVMGISWGGIITSTAIGIDDRFRFAIPTYGCGNLDESLDSYYGPNLSTNDLYKEVWDPMVRITNATMPVLWSSWPNDEHFSLACQADTYNGAPGEHMVSLVPGMLHGHAAAWDRPESYAYADSIVSNGTGWCIQQSATLSNGVAEVVFQSDRTLDSAVLVSTVDGGFTGNRLWTETVATLVDNGGGSYTLSAALPDYSTAWFMNGLDGTLVASSDYQETVPAGIEETILTPVAVHANAAFTPDYAEDGLIDGSGLTDVGGDSDESNDTHNNVATDMWLDTSTDAPENSYVIFDLGAVHTLGHALIWQYNEDVNSGNRGVAAMDISFRESVGGGVTDTSGFSNAVSVSLSKATGAAETAAQIKALGSVQARYVMFDNMSNHFGNDAINNVGLSEVRFTEAGGDPFDGWTIIDNSDSIPGYVESGTWFNTGGADVNDWHGDSRFTFTAGDVATWTFTGLSNGTYEVAASWSVQANRSQVAPFSVQGITNLVNQRILADDFTLNDGSDDIPFATISTNAAVTAGTLTLTLTQIANGGTDYCIADAVAVRASTNASPDAYETWVASYGLTGDDALPKTDVEPDGLDNLMEYALGGNPTNDDATAIAPDAFLADEGGTNWFHHLHNERDVQALTYSIGTATDLVSTVEWDTNDVSAVGASAFVDSIRTVTNRTEVSADAKFIKLTVEKQ